MVTVVNTHTYTLYCVGLITSFILVHIDDFVTHIYLLKITIVFPIYQNSWFCTSFIYLDSPKASTCWVYCWMTICISSRKKLKFPIFPNELQYFFGDMCADIFGTPCIMFVGVNTNQVDVCVSPLSVNKYPHEQWNYNCIW